MALSRCPECGSMVSDRAESCPVCGCPIKKNPQVCPECGHPLDGTETECPECGFPIDAQTESGVSSSTFVEGEPDPDPGRNGSNAQGKKKMPSAGIAAAVAAILLIGGFFLVRSIRRDWMTGWWESPETFFFFGEKKNVHYYIDKNSVSRFETYLTDTEQRPADKKPENLPLGISVNRRAKELSVGEGTLTKLSTTPQDLKEWDDLGEPLSTCPSWVIGNWSFQMEGGSTIVKITDEKVYSTPALPDYYEDDFVSRGKYTYKSNGTFGYLSYGQGPLVLDFKNARPLYSGTPGVASPDIKVKSGSRRAAAKEWLQGRWRLDLGDYVYSYLIFKPNKVTMYMPLERRMIDDSGPYTILGDNVILNLHSAGKVTLPIDIYNKKLYSVKHQEFEKMSASTSDEDLMYNPGKSKKSGRKSSSGRRSSSGIYFSSAADAYDYIFSSRFRNRSNTVELEFTQQGLCANGNYISGAPQIINASSSEALVKVRMVISPETRYFKVNPVSGYVYDTTEGIYYYKK